MALMTELVEPTTQFSRAPTAGRTNRINKKGGRGALFSDGYLRYM